MNKYFIVKRKMFDGKYIMIAIFKSITECNEFISNYKGVFIII